MDYLQSAENEFISSYLLELNARSIKYCVLRKHEKIFDFDSGDIDCLIDVKHINFARNIFIKIAKKLNFKVISADIYNKNLLLKAALNNEKMQINNKRIVYFHFMVYASLYLTDNQRKITGLSTRVWIDQIDLEEVVVNDAKLMVPDDKWKLVLMYSRLEFRNYQSYKEGCANLYQRLLAYDRDNILHDIQTGGANASFSGFNVFDRDVLQKLYMFASVKSRGSNFMNIIRLMLVNMKEMIKPKGLIIVFSGPDGAGKTTTNQGLSDLLCQQYDLKINNVKHLYPLNKKMGKAAVKAQAKIRGIDPSNDDGMERDRGNGLFWKYRRLIGLLLIIFQYPFGYMGARIKTLKGVTTIVDTSVLDAFIKGHRPQFKVVEKLFIRLLPKADIWFVLKAHPDVIVARKPELTNEEITEYYKRIGELSELSRSEPVYISSEHGEEEALSEVSSIVIDMLDGISCKS